MSCEDKENPLPPAKNTHRSLLLLAFKVTRLDELQSADSGLVGHY